MANSSLRWDLVSKYSPGEKIPVLVGPAGFYKPIIRIRTNLIKQQLNCDLIKTLKKLTLKKTEQKLSAQLAHLVRGPILQSVIQNIITPSSLNQPYANLFFLLLVDR